MHMKLFTLSAVCVLVYGLMVALSGVMGFPGFFQQEEYSSQGGRIKEIAARGDIGDPASAALAAQDGSPRHGQTPAMQGDAGQEGSLHRNRQIQIIGILFILGWVILSVKLLTAD